MTKSFFMKFLALFLTGTMLVGVGCKSYDDDINRIDDKLNNLDKEVITLNKLTDRVAAVEKTAAEFKAIDFSKYVKNDELTTKLGQIQAELAAKLSQMQTELTTKLGQLQTEFNNKLNGYVTTGALADAKKALEGQIEAKTTIGEVKGLLEGYVTKAEALAAHAAITAELKAEIKTAIENKAKELAEEMKKITEDTNEWLGPHFEKYMERYVTTEEFANSVSSVILGNLESANQEYVDAIKNLVDGDNPVIRKSEMDDLLKTYQTEIDKIWAAIGDLAGRIQSLVYVPKNIMNFIQFGSMYIEDAVTGKKIMLNKAFSADITFRVTPASLAEDLVKQYKLGEIKMSFLYEEVDLAMKTRAAAQELVEITNAVAGADGKIVLTTNCNYDFEKSIDNNKTISIALNIAEVTKEGDMQGVDFSSDYVSVLGGDNECLDQFVLAKKDKDGKYEAISNAAAYELIYNSKETLSVLADYSLVFEKAGAYTTIAEAAAEYHWDNVPTLAIKNESVTFATKAMEGHYTVTPATVKGSTTPVQIAVKTPTADDITKTIAVLTNVGMVVGTENVSLATENAKVTSTVTITSEPLAEIKNVNTTLNWTYDSYINSYKKDIQLPTGKLTVEQFKSIDWTAIDWSEVKATDCNVVGNIELSTEAISNPSADGDVQIIRYNVEGYKNGNGAFNVYANVQINKAQTIKISGVITFNGLPDLNYTLVTPAAPKYEYPTNFVIVPVTNKLNKELFATVPAATPKYFESQAEFDAFLATLKLDNVRQGKDDTHNVTASLEGENNYTGLHVRFRKSDLEDFNNASYTYTAPKDALLGIDINSDVFFKVNITGSVNIEKNKSFYLKRGVDLNDGPTADDIKFMYAVSKLDKVANTVTIPNVDMANGAYSVGKPAGATENVAITYTLKSTKPTGYTGNMPLIDGNAVEGSTGSMNWNGCQLDKVAVEVTLKVEGLIVDQRTYEVRLKTMIDFASWAAFKEGTLKVKDDNTDQSINLYTLMLLAAKDTKDNVLFEKDGTEGKDLFAWASAAAGYEVAVAIDNSKITYTGGSADIYSRFHLSATDQKIFVADKSNSPLQQGVTITATIPVTFTYKYAVALDGKAFAPVKFTKNITVKITNF